MHEKLTNTQRAIATVFFNKDTFLLSFTYTKDDNSVSNRVLSIKDLEWSGNGEVLVGGSEFGVENFKRFKVPNISNAHILKQITQDTDLDAVEGITYERWW